MGKRAKAHRAKVAKRNRRLAQEKYSMQNSLNKLMEEMAKKQDTENLNIETEGKEVPFEVITEPIQSGIKGFEVSETSEEPVVVHDGMSYNPENPAETLETNIEKDDNEEG
jgi:hypothetical protein